ncbi:MAG: hypothetical protein WB973_14555 [Thermoanaerobaculia bacterium]
MPTGAGAVLHWWESRRLAYNIVVGIAGIITVSLLVANSLIRGDDCGIPDPPLFALLLIIGYGVMANVFQALRTIRSLHALFQDSFEKDIPPANQAGTGRR